MVSLQLTSESTLTATSPGGLGHPQLRSLVVPSSGFHTLGLAASPSGPSGEFKTPPRNPPLVLPRTPGYSSPEGPTLDFTKAPAPSRVSSLQTSWEQPWDQLSTISSRDSPPKAGKEQETPLTWQRVVDTVYASGLVDMAALPASPQQVRSVIGGPPPAKRPKMALPPSPLAAACLDNAMRACWGGAWPNHLQQQQPPANAALHPTPAVWVPEFKHRYHAGPGFDLKPARLSAREREWAGSQQPPTDHAWMNEIDMMARAQLSSMSALEWILGVLFDSQNKASPTQLQALKDFAARELTHATNFSGAIISASTLARRKAILDTIQTLPSSTKNWLQLQPVDLNSNQGLFGAASAAVPDIIRQQPAKAPAFRRPTSRPAPRPREQPRERARPPAARPAPSATYTPSAAATETQPEKRQNRQGRGPTKKAASKQHA